MRASLLISASPRSCILDLSIKWSMDDLPLNQFLLPLVETIIDDFVFIRLPNAW